MGDSIKARGPSFLVGSSEHVRERMRPAAGGRRDLGFGPLVTSLVCSRETTYLAYKVNNASFMSFHQNL